MDTSETYIKMRLAAIPDLGRGIPPEFFGLTECTWINSTVYIDHKGDWYYSDETKACQLERQDQLQEMSWDKEYLEDNIHHLLLRFHDTIKGTYYIQFTSMEQLWLAFVMKQRYSELWNGEDWIADKEMK